MESASLARTAPLAPIGFASRATGPSGSEADARILMIYPRYFATMGLAIVRGRDFDEADLRPGAPLVALANETFVRQVLDGREALGPGATVTLGRDRDRDRRRRQGLAPAGPSQRDPADASTRRSCRPTPGRGQMVLHVRVAGSAARLVPQIREAVQGIDKDVPVFEIHSLAEEMDAAFVRERLVATLSGFFGIVALTLVCVGLYGLMSFTVARRTAEIGVRVALGAPRAGVSWLIARQTLTLVLAGIAAGLPIAWRPGATRVAPVVGDAVRAHAGRSDHDGRGDRRAGPRGDGRRVAAGAPRGADRSDRRPPQRVICSCRLQAERPPSTLLPPKGGNYRDQRRKRQGFVGRQPRFRAP